MQRGVPALQTHFSQPQYLIAASYCRTKQGHWSPSRKEALRACFGCSPSYEFLIGIPALQSSSEVKVKAIPTESLTLSHSTPNLTARELSFISCSHNSSIYFFYFISNHQVQASRSSLRARFSDRTIFQSVRPHILP